MAHLSAQAGALVLTVVFAWSAAVKVLRWGTWRAIVPRYRLPSGVEAVTLGAVPIVEGAVPILFLAGASRSAAALALALLAAFSLAVLRARRLQGDRLPCGCFGTATARDYRVVIARNALLGAAAALVMVPGRDVALFEGLGAPGASDVVPVLLAATGVALIAWMLWTLRASSRSGR